MKIKNHLLAVLVLALLLPGRLPAESIFAPYGIGLMERNESVRTTGLGGSGTALSDSAYFHLDNPATWYSAGKTRYTMSIFLKRSYARDVTGKDRSDEFFFPSMALAAPIYRSLSLGVGITSLTDYNYLFSGRADWPASNSQVDTVDSHYSEYFQGEGGLGRFNANIAARFGKWSFGIAGDVYFGKMDNARIIDFEGTDYYTSGRSERREFSGYGVRLGAQGNITPELSVGATIALPTPLKVNTSIRFQNGELIEKDYPDYELPLRLRGGVALLTGRWLTALDLAYDLWGETSTGWENESLYENTLSAFIGVERQPLKGPLDPWFKKWYYRAGARYEENYRLIAGEKVPTYGVAVGTGFPSKRAAGVLDFALTVDFRGDAPAFDTREIVWGFHIGWSAGEKWFVRRTRY